MEIHRIVFELFTRNGVAIERQLDDFKKEYQVLTPQRLTKSLKASDNLVTFEIPTGIPFSYVAILATYLADDAALGVKATDPAPIAVRLNGSTADLPIPGGLLAWTGGITGLQVGTPYDTNKILVEVYLG